MKSLNVLTFVILCVFALSSCQNSETKRIREQARQALPVSPSPSATATPAAPNSLTSNNEPHYKCPNNCAGGIGDSAAPCPVCGTTLAHNQAYHNQASPAVTTPNATATPPGASPQATPPAQPSPAQNAAGVYHYTCSAGCAGGAGGAGNCATCGGALAHNPAYHN